MDAKLVRRELKMPNGGLTMRRFALLIPALLLAAPMLAGPADCGDPNVPFSVYSGPPPARVGDACTLDGKPIPSPGNVVTQSTCERCGKWWMVKLDSGELRWERAWTVGPAAIPHQPAVRRTAARVAEWARFDAWCAKTCKDAAAEGSTMLGTSNGEDSCGCDENARPVAFIASRDTVPTAEQTPEQRAKVAACWERERDDCLAECGGSLADAHGLCRIDHAGVIHSGGLGCSMPAEYEACAEVVHLRRELAALKAECYPTTNKPAEQ